MTAIFYSDCEATSPNGRFTLEARSPHNGTIPHRDGKPASDAEFGFKYREHQSHFRYRLLDNTPRSVIKRLVGNESRSVVWERWQPDREDSPHEVVVSDEGWSVIRTHGFSPELIAVGPDGVDTIRVSITSDDPESDGSVPASTAVRWPLQHLAFTTAGQYWSQHSWPTFCHHDGRVAFSWRTARGQQLVVDLTHAVAYPDSTVPAELAESVKEAERKSALSLLANLSRRMDEVRSLLTRRKQEGDEAGEEDDELLGMVARATAAIHLVGVHRLSEGIPFLREWEGLDVPSSSMGSNAMTDGWWLQTQYMRPLVQYALKLLGEEPLGYATYHFKKMDNTERRFPMPEFVPERRARAAAITVAMTAEEVLHLLGSPDYVAQQLHETRTPGFWSSEVWEYDFLVGKGWVTVRLTWHSRSRKITLAAVEEVGPYWLESDVRLGEYLGW